MKPKQKKVQKKQRQTTKQKRTMKLKVVVEMDEQAKAAEAKSPWQGRRREPK